MVIEEPLAVKDQTQILHLGPNRDEDQVDRDGSDLGQRLRLVLSYSASMTDTPDGQARQSR